MGGIGNVRVSILLRILMRCSFLVLIGHKCTDDFHYRLAVQFVNSGLNNIFT